jgi:hypothetical protein
MPRPKCLLRAGKSILGVTACLVNSLAAKAVGPLVELLGLFLTTQKAIREAKAVERADGFWLDLDRVAERLDRLGRPPSLEFKLSEPPPCTVPVRAPL